MKDFTTTPKSLEPSEEFRYIETRQSGFFYSFLDNADTSKSKL